MLLAETTILFGFHPVRMKLLFLLGIVVPLLALRARQCDPCTHSFPPHFLE